MIVSTDDQFTQKILLVQAKTQPRGFYCLLRDQRPKCGITGEQNHEIS